MPAAGRLHFMAPLKMQLLSPKLSWKEDLKIKRKMNEVKYHQECVVDVIS